MMLNLIGINSGSGGALPSFLTVRHMQTDVDAFRSVVPAVTIMDKIGRANTREMDFTIVQSSLSKQS